MICDEQTLRCIAETMLEWTPTAKQSAETINKAGQAITALREILLCDALCTEISYKGAPAGTSRRRDRAIKKARRALR